MIATRTIAPGPPNESDSFSSPSSLSAANIATAPAADASSTSHTVLPTFAILRSPRLRCSRKPPMNAPAMNATPFAAPSRITTCWLSAATSGVSADSAIFTPVMPRMIQVGVQACSRA